ncbi:MAG: Mrp/NBP35 family ATP-binding protein [Bacillota bacterium]|nr:Mrp/NBP35 family ATP-binding protein [Bacillota bacterium]
MTENCTHNCSSCTSDCDQRQAEPAYEQPAAGSQIKKVIGVISGKGGVGKSLVTSMLAVLMAREGFRIAIMDADMTGPSIPQAFGVEGLADSDERGLFPALSKSGVAMMSVNLLLQNHTDPVVWRGPVIAGTVKQFWTHVQWGDIDYMFVDMPPGTGDVPLTVFQSLPVDGVIVVASPQQLVGMIVEKAVNMAQLMKIPVLALVENMSYFTCPDCGKQHHIFGASHIEDIAARHQIDSVCRLPIDPRLAAAMDAGRIEHMTLSQLDPLIEQLIALGEA